MDWDKKRVLVFGGGGFLGRYIVEQLLDLGCKNITSFGRSDQPELREIGINVLQGDMRDSNAVESACDGVDIVFLTAAKAGVWGSWNDYYGINVDGAGNVVDACRNKGVSALVYTSSPSVAYSAEEDIENMNEDNPYPASYLAYYPKSKAIGEQIVLDANCESLKTVSLRPHLIWGPRDPHLIPRVLNAAAKGKLRIVGDGKNKVDMTYVANGAHAHICAAETLMDPQRCKKAEGRAYFISDDAPVRLWSWTNELLDRCDIPELNRYISYKKAFTIGCVLECIYKIVPFIGEPPMTRFIAGQFAHSHWFDISAAKERLGYSPIVDPNDGFEKLVDALDT